MSTIQVPQGFSYALAAATSTIFLNIFQANKVARARKAAAIPYPQEYADKAEAAASSLAHKFNCTQRAHQNTLENTPFTILSILTSGLKYPYVAAALGAGWFIGRVLYTIGYSTGDPAKRNFPGGLVSTLSFVGLLGTASYTVYSFIQEGL